MSDTTAAIRRSRRARHMAERRRRREALLAALVAILVLLAFALAGAADYHDRAEGLGASMVPTPGWERHTW